MRNSIKSGINKIFGTYCGIYDKFFWKEQKKYGIPDSNKYFVIRRQGWKIGLFSYFCTNLGHIKWAVENGYTPVVDMSSYPNIYIQKGSENKINAWDYFFKQPCNVTLEDVKWHMRLLSSGEEPQEFPIYTKECLNPDTDEYKMWKAYADKYISYSDIAKEEIEKAYNLLIQKEDKVLGVLCRGTDYTSKNRITIQYNQQRKWLLKKLRVYWITDIIKYFLQQRMKRSGNNLLQNSEIK